jgi:hypothetical protein
MQELHLVWWAILAAGAARFLLGWVWYSALFSKDWMKASGVSVKQMKGGAAKAVPVDLIFCLVMAFVLGHAVKYAQMGHGVPDGATGGALSGFFNWLGFIVPLLLGSVLYEQKPMKLFWINAGYNFASLLIMGAILAVWA